MTDSSVKSHKGVLATALLGCLIFAFFYVESAHNAFSWAYSGIKPTWIILWWGLLLISLLGIGHVTRKGKIAMHSMFAILFYLISHPFLQDVLLQLNPLKVAAFTDVLIPLKTVRTEFASDELNTLQYAFWIFFPMLLLRVKRWPIYVASCLVLGLVLLGGDKLLGHEGVGLLKLYSIPAASLALLLGLGNDKDWWLGAVRGPLLLILVSFLGHQRLGYFPLGQHRNFEVRYVNPLRSSAQELLDARLPEEPNLFCLASEKKLFLSMADVVVVQNLKEFFRSKASENKVCIVSLDELAKMKNSFYMRGIEKGRYSVEAYNKNFCLLSAVKKKGKNDQLLTEVKLQEKTALASHGFKHVGVDTYIDHHGPVRYWDGKGDGTPANIFYRQWVTLPAGKHEMIVRFKLGSLNPKSPYENNGLIQIYKAASDDLINQTELRLSEEKGFTQQTLSFELKDSQRVEFRLLAGNLALYLDSYSYKIGN